MTITEEAVESIEHLDFTPPCEAKNIPAHDASHVLVCRGCGQGVLICEKHLRALRRKLAGGIRSRGSIECSKCHRASRSLEEAMEVIPL